MARCVICNYCSDLDSYVQDNFMEEGYDYCIKCASVIEETLADYPQEEEENLPLEDTIDATGSRKPVDGDLEKVRYPSSQEKEGPS